MADGHKVDIIPEYSLILVLQAAKLQIIYKKKAKKSKIILCFLDFALPLPKNNKKVLSNDNK